MRIWTVLKFHVFVWLGSKLFTYIDICCPDKKEVVGITFSNYKGYIEKVSDLE